MNTHKAQGAGCLRELGGNAIMERVLGGLYEGKEYQQALQEAKDEYRRWEFNKKNRRIENKNKGIDIMNLRRMKQEFQELVTRGAL